VRLLGHLGQILRAATKAEVGWIVVALVANCVTLRLLIEFCQLWYLGLALPAVLYGPSCALLHAGAWGGSALANRLRGGRVVALAAFATFASAAGLFTHSPGLVVGAQAAGIAGVTLLNIVLTRRLHEAMPSHIRAGASSVVSTMGYGLFVPAALGLGLVSRAHGIFEASVFVAGPLGVMCLSVARAQRSARAAGGAQRPAGAARSAQRPAGAAGELPRPLAPCQAVAGPPAAFGDSGRERVRDTA
jgi:hypothetical protein